MNKPGTVFVGRGEGALCAHADLATEYTYTRCERMAAVRVKHWEDAEDTRLCCNGCAESMLMSGDYEYEPLTAEDVANIGRAE